MNNAQLTWFKSSYSSGEGGECLEVAYTWRKSSYSSGEGGDCLEIAQCPSTIHLRDSKTPDAPHVTVAPATWAAFLGGATAGAARPAGGLPGAAG